MMSYLNINIHIQFYVLQHCGFFLHLLLVPTFTVNGQHWKSWKRTRAFTKKSNASGTNTHKWSTFSQRYCWVPSNDVWKHMNSFHRVIVRVNQSSRIVLIYWFVLNQLLVLSWLVCTVIPHASVRLGSRTHHEWQAFTDVH